ncbi:MAG TPA: SDR family NAD(P)-dependent oxidoreductase [Pseudonocardia sp.]|nr:SDR family NAD(P)-dependent oxidoreductase [Pseudonocardia sp.]
MSNAATGSIAVVTGAGSGIGSAIAARLAKDGYSVVVADIDEDAAAEVAGGFGGRAEYLDVTDDDAVFALAEALADEHDRLDVWVNNAGISAMTPFLETSSDQVDRTLAVNLRAVFMGAQAAARAMVRTATRGRIVNVASMAGKQGRVPYLADYVASKFGVVGLTQAIAYELAEHRITVNSVCPGYVATPMQSRELGWEARLRGVEPADVRDLWVADTPLGRLEQPEDVANAVAFLVSDQSGFITGEALAVNGGAFMD